MTLLDQALKAAQTDPSRQGAFYDLFLNVELYIPTHDHPTSLGVRRTGPQETFRPVILDYKGNRIIPIFDTLEKLTAWARRPIGYIQVTAYAFLQSLAGRMHLALNIGTPGFKEFVADEVEWLKKAVQSSQPKERTIPTSTQMYIGAPSKIPPGLLQGLEPVLRKNKEVKAAFLGLVAYDGAEAEPTLVLVIQLKPGTEQFFPSIVENIGMTVRGLLKRKEAMDIILRDGQAPSAIIAKQVRPFYQA